jgi:beta-lactamase regulating signal transducer with metallopeptidase domain
MGIGVGLFLIAAGAILTFAVNVTTSGFNINTIGVILMVVGVVGVIVELAVFAPRRRTVVATAPTARRTVVEERQDAF